jgi:fructosamine-3-kinase
MTPVMLLDQIVDRVPLSGGAANEVWAVTLADGRQLVLKASASVDPGVFPSEADGLAVLASHVRTPPVLEVSAKHLMLERQAGAPADPRFWAAAGRAIAGLHEVRSERFGWPVDGWLGLMPQENGFLGDGYEFFATRRILRYVREPLVRSTLPAAVLAGLERIAERLPSLLPPAPAVLNHGDLYTGNVVASPVDGAPVFIDPAVCYLWAESDLSMMFGTGEPPMAFFDGYQELAPLADGWQERMQLLYIRELLSVVAHFGAYHDYPERVLDVVRRYASSGRSSPRQ